MSDLISKSALLEKLIHCVGLGRRSFEVVIKEIKEQPTVEAVPVVRGKWIRVPSSDMVTGEAYKCSECGKMRYGSFLPNFCQHCGADMRERVQHV